VQVDDCEFNTTYSYPFIVFYTADTWQHIYFILHGSTFILSYMAAHLSYLTCCSINDLCSDIFTAKMCFKEP